MAKTCVTCGKKIGAFAEWQTCQGGCLCQGCYDTAFRYRDGIGYLSAREVADAIAKVKMNDDHVAGFHETRRIGNKFGFVAIFDDEARRVLLPRKLSDDFDKQGLWMFPYDDIVSAELLRNEEVVHASGLGRAVAGGLLFGFAGAAAGYASAQDKRANAGSDSVEVNVKVRNYHSSFYRISLLDSGMMDAVKIERCLGYAVELIEQLNEIAGYVEPPEEQAAAVVQVSSDADELRKFKALLDDGVISQEEFDAKKAQLLGFGAVTF